MIKELKKTLKDFGIKSHTYSMSIERQNAKYVKIQEKLDEYPEDTKHITIGKSQSKKYYLYQNDNLTSQEIYDALKDNFHVMWTGQEYHCVVVAEDAETYQREYQQAVAQISRYQTLISEITDLPVREHHEKLEDSKNYTVFERVFYYQVYYRNAVDYKTTSERLDLCSQYNVPLSVVENAIQGDYGSEAWKKSELKFISEIERTHELGEKSSEYFQTIESAEKHLKDRWEELVHSAPEEVRPYLDKQKFFDSAIVEHLNTYYVIK